MTFPAKVQLMVADTEECVEALLVELTTREAKAGIDSRWWVLPGVEKRRKFQEKDHHWRWGDRIGRLTNDKWHRCLAIKTTKGTIEGAILYWLNTLSAVNPVRGAVSLKSLATAPHNRASLVDMPHFRGVGQTLLLKAVLDSYRNGFGGRVTLESFNDSSTIAFYENRGFEIVRYDVDGEERLPILELSSEAAEGWLQAEGFLE
jgi:GNAT superfamily N-acetyltransferase